MRYRERTNHITGETFDLWGFCYLNAHTPLCPVSDVTETYNDTFTYEAMWDVETPNFKQLSAAGEIINSKMVREEISAYVEPTFVNAVYECSWKPEDNFKSGYVQITDLLLNQGLLELTEWEQAVDDKLLAYQSERNVAIAQAWANVDESELLAWASIGEMPETYRWLVSLYRRGIKVLALFKGKKLRMQLRKDLGKMSPVEYADAISNFWLELRYALRPLLFEMEQLITALDSSSKPPRRTARGFYDIETNSDTTERVDTGARQSLERRARLKRESIYRAGILYEISDTDVNWVEVLGLDKPLESIWELTKLSFLIDWFLNVGDIISSHTTSVNLTPLASWIVEDHTFKTTYDYSGYERDQTGQNFQITSMIPTYGLQEATHRLVRRSIDLDKPWLPSIKINLDWAKIVDLAAIARSFYRAFKR